MIEEICEDIILEMARIYSFLLEESQKQKTENDIKAMEILYDNLWDLYI